MPPLNGANLWALPSDSAQSILVALASALEAKHPPMTAFSAELHEGTAPYSVRDGVAVIPICGTITRSTERSLFGEAVTIGQDEIRATLDQALADPTVRAIMLSINSPGGMVAGTKELADRIVEARAVKPIAAYADGCMASAAMWLGAAAGRVFAPVTATVGSVGVLWVHTDWSRTLEQWGITRSYITGGKWKAAGNPDSPLGDEERAHFQGQVNAIHTIFKSDVARFLGITAPAEQWAEGQTILASDAAPLGLVTAIVSGLDAAIAAIRPEATMTTKAPAAPLDAAPVTAEAPAAIPQEAQANAASSARAEVLALVKIVAGTEAHGKIESLLAAGISPAQLEALAPLLDQGAALPATSHEATVKAQILQGIAAVTPGPVATGSPITTTAAPSKLVADAERRRGLSDHTAKA